MPFQSPAEAIKTCQIALRPVRRTRLSGALKCPTGPVGRVHETPEQRFIGLRRKRQLQHAVQPSAFSVIPMEVMTLFVTELASSAWFKRSPLCIRPTQGLAKAMSPCHTFACTGHALMLGGTRVIRLDRRMAPQAGQRADAST